MSKEGINRLLNAVKPRLSDLSPTSLLAIEDIIEAYRMFKNRKLSNQLRTEAESQGHLYEGPTHGGVASARLFSAYAKLYPAIAYFGFGGDNAYGGAVVIALGQLIGNASKRYAQTDYSVLEQKLQSQTRVHNPS